MKKELFLFVFLSVFITLIDLGAQIQGAQTRYTVVNFGLNQPLIACWNQCRKDHAEVVLVTSSFIFPFFILCPFASIFSRKMKTYITTLLFYLTNLLLICRKNVMGKFLNSYWIIIMYSFIAFAFCWTMLLCPGLTVNCFFYFVFNCWIFPNKLDLNIAKITQTKSEVCLNNLAQDLKMTLDQLFAKNFHSMAWGLYINIFYDQDTLLNLFSKELSEIWRCKSSHPDVLDI